MLLEVPVVTGSPSSNDEARLGNGHTNENGTVATDTRKDSSSHEGDSASTTVDNEHIIAVNGTKKEGSHMQTDPEEGSGEGDSEDDEEEEEPSLKYERIGGDLAGILEKETASTIAVGAKLMALGTHGGVVHIATHDGTIVKSYRAHTASVNDITLDTQDEFVATASMDGQAVIYGIAGTETYSFDLKRPIKAIALDPQFAKKGTRAFVCGGMAGTLVMHEKGWLGHKESLIHSNEGPIWAIAWRSTLIAWANDVGIRIHDTNTEGKLMSIARPAGSPRADLFKCTLRWQDDTTLLVSWADHIILARIRSRSMKAGVPGVSLVVEITAHFQVDCMLSGIVPHLNPLGSFLTLDYIPPDTFSNEDTQDREEQRRKAANVPELRIISRTGEELSSDALLVKDYHRNGCNDYWLEPSVDTVDPFYIVVSPKNLIRVKLRDAVDHITWLVEREKYEEALTAVEQLGSGKGVDVAEVGRKYIEHLVEQGEFEKAAQLCSRVFGKNAKDWEDCIFIFRKRGQLEAITPYVPTKEPQLSRIVYEMVIAHFLQHDLESLLRTIREWPIEIYDIAAVIVAVKARVDRAPGSAILMECIAELYMRNKQPGKALEYYLRLRKPDVFDLIRDHNLFVVVRDQALLLVEFDLELEKSKRAVATKAENSPEQKSVKGKEKEKGTSQAITLLVDHPHAIPVARVVEQLRVRPYYLYLYLDALFDRDPYLASDFADDQVVLYAEYESGRLIDFLRASNYYSLERAYQICKKRDMVPEMVFLLGRMGGDENNKEALNLIIERLGDVNRAIDFAKEQNDEDLWERLLKYSETRPAFIRGLLENVGAEINPIGLIRRIKNGLEIPGLKEALIKILWDFNLQMSLLEGCQKILHSDCTTLAARLQARQVNGYLGVAARPCPVCSLPLFNTALLHPSAMNSRQPLALLFLCRHLVHAACVKGGGALPTRSTDDLLMGFLEDGADLRYESGTSISGKIAYAAIVRSRLQESCPACRASEGGKGVVTDGSHR
ncbi:Vacuolar protein sorting-associated protein 41 [Tulasnella sp. JGI-2019a]|nr:Vacuolar protein sorting-associated protein 41 [Tulasnella sp. JGI-2019a]KAG9038539.1 Vacuolar protein sorting-associated protein 41 [Tulasnella sp. JGI-2019a]